MLRLVFFFSHGCFALPESAAFSAVWQPTDMTEIHNSTKMAIDEKFLSKIAQRVLKNEKIKSLDLSVAFIGAPRMRELNRRYRRKDTIANVLSFSFAPSRKEPPCSLGLGEIVICPQQVRKDAKKYGILFKKALAWMLLHGILHLAGYTHEGKSSDAQKMEERENFYLKTLNP